MIDTCREAVSSSILMRVDIRSGKVDALIYEDGSAKDDRGGFWRLRFF
jgi:hypothetical protein